MKKQIQLWLRGVLVAVMAVTLLLMGCNTSTDVSKPAADEAVAPAPVVAASSPVASSSSGGLPQESVQVHGHWTIEVRNPDGTLAEIREFDNALTSGRALALILARSNSVGGWQIELEDFTTGPFSPSNGSGHGYIYEPGAVVAPGSFTTLTVAESTDGLSTVLSGTVIAVNNGDIGSVKTTLDLLPNTVPPSSTLDGGALSFTRTVLDSPIVLQAGQQAVVTVVISFS